MSRTPFRAFIRAHWPALAAYLEGNVRHAFKVLNVYAWRELQARRRPAWCIECRLLMVANEFGIHFCPYRHFKYHAIAKRAGAAAV
jgi:hypothetical protein